MHAFNVESIKVFLVHRTNEMPRKNLVRKDENLKLLTYTLEGIFYLAALKRPFGHERAISVR